MKPQIALVTLITDSVEPMMNFYHDVLGFPIKTKMEQYVEFESPGIRFALCERNIMLDATGREEYMLQPEGHAFELAFPVESPDAVDAVYSSLLKQGATGIKPPEDMPWGQRTGFFADPDGNIHEIFADLPQTDTQGE